MSSCQHQRPRRPFAQRAAHVTLISGFTQHEGQGSGNGLFTLWHETLRLYSGGPRLTIEYRPWHTDWRDYAETVRLCLKPYDQKRIVVAGYSYGGDAAVRLCRELGRCGLEVDVALLCDPVRRPGWRPLFLRRFPSPASLLSCWPLTLSKNVRRCEYWWQRNRSWDNPASWPQGHHVYYHPSRLHGSLCNARKVDDLQHDRMDEHPGFAYRLTEIVQQLAGEICSTGRRAA